MRVCRGDAVEEQERSSVVHKMAKYVSFSLSATMLCMLKTMHPIDNVRNLKIHKFG
jgi:hypothetical protein